MTTQSIRSLADALGAMPETVARLAGGLSADELRWKPKPDAFSFVEQACHLRDLEIEGYAVRIERLLVEDHPNLEGFDGARVAAERDYLAEEFVDALAAFARARAANVARAAELSTADLEREGTFAGETPITLAGVLEAMRVHDLDHLGEMERLREAIARA